MKQLNPLIRKRNDQTIDNIQTGEINQISSSSNESYKRNRRNKVASKVNIKSYCLVLKHMI